MSYYIYYQKENGNILAVSNERDDTISDNFIEIDLETHKKFSSGEYLVTDWAVLSSPKNDNVIELVKRIKDEKEFDVDKSTKQIEKVSRKPKNSFIIEQYTKSKRWKISNTLNDSNLIYYTQTDGYVDQKKEIYVIQEDNPNILLDTFVISFKDLLTSEKNYVTITNSKIANRKDVSLICRRTEENFVHIVR